MQKRSLIYILGNSYSGSTLIGSLLGSASNAVFLGELKYFPRKFKAHKICSCGQLLGDCEIWSGLMDTNLQAQSVNELNFQKKFLPRLLLGKEIVNELQVKVRVESEFLSALFDRVEEGQIIIDSSKNVYRHHILNQIEEIDLKTVYIKRGMRQNVSSHIGHRKPLWKAIAIYVLKHWSLRKYLRRYKVDYTFLNYTALCHDPETELRRVFDELNLSGLKINQKKIEVFSHAATGNAGTRKQDKDKKITIREDSNWREGLNSWQKFFIRSFLPS